MKNILPNLAFTICISLSVIVSGCVPQQSANENELRAGIAEIDITPPVGHRMAGYFDERLATGIHDPLMAKAMVVQHGKEQIAFVFCDLVGVSLNVSKKARAAAS